MTHEGVSARGYGGIPAREGETTGFGRNAREIFSDRESHAGAPCASWRPVQFCTWLGLFCMWLYFRAGGRAERIRRAGREVAAVHAGRRVGRTVLRDVLGGVLRVFVGAAVAGARDWAAQSTRTRLPARAARLGFFRLSVIHDKWFLLLSMVGVGIAWASTLSMPYAILAGSLPPGKTGIYMGIFNFFIVLPEILASLGFGWVMNHLLGNNRLYAVIAGGGFLIVAALLVTRVRDTAAPELAGVRAEAAVRS